MSARVTHRDRPDANGWSLTYGVLIGPLAWFAHFAVGYLIETTRCVSGLSAASVWIHLATLIALALVVAGGVISWQSWQRLRGRDERRRETAAGRMEFVALSGVLLNALFGLTILVSGIAPLFLEHCS